MFDIKNNFEIADHRLSPMSAHGGGWFGDKPFDGRFKNQMNRRDLSCYHFYLPTFWRCNSRGEDTMGHPIYSEPVGSLGYKRLLDMSNTHYTYDQMLGKQLRFSK